MVFTHSHMSLLNGLGGAAPAPPIGVQDLTTYTLLNTAADLSVISSKVDYTAMLRNSESSLHLDFGEDFFGDFDIDFDTEITARTTNSWSIMGLSNTLGDYFDMDAANNGILIFHTGGSRVQWHIRNMVDLSGDYYDPFFGQWDVLKYWTFDRSGTTARARVYSDSNRTTLLDTITVTVPTTKFRYFYALCGFGKDADPTAPCTGYFQNFNIVSAG